MASIIVKCPGCDAEDLLGCDNCGSDDKFTLEDRGARCDCEELVTVFDCDCGAEVRPKFFRVASAEEVAETEESLAHETGARGLLNAAGSVVFGLLALVAIAHFGFGLGKPNGDAVGAEVEKILEGISSDVGSENEAAVKAFVAVAERDKEKFDNLERTPDVSFESKLFEEIHSLAKSGDLEALKEAQRSAAQVCARYSGYAPMVLCTIVETTMASILADY